MLHPHDTATPSFFPPPGKKILNRLFLRSTLFVFSKPPPFICNLALLGAFFPGLGLALKISGAGAASASSDSRGAGVTSPGTDAEARWETLRVAMSAAALGLRWAVDVPVPEDVASVNLRQ